MCEWAASDWSDEVSHHNQLLAPSPTLAGVSIKSGRGARQNSLTGLVVAKIKVRVQLPRAAEYNVEAPAGETRRT